VKRHLACGLSVIVGVSLLVACGSDSKDSAADVQTTNTAFCKDLGTYGTALTALAALDPTTATKADYSTAADAVKAARSDLAKSGGDLVDAQVTNLESQANDLEGALKDAPDDAAVADIVTAAQTQVTEVKASIATVGTAVCTAPGSTTTT
jgi:hypothetical protein